MRLWNSFLVEPYRIKTVKKGKKGILRAFVVVSLLYFAVSLDLGAFESLYVICNKIYFSLALNGHPWHLSLSVSSVLIHLHILHDSTSIFNEYIHQVLIAISPQRLVMIVSPCCKVKWSAYNFCPLFLPSSLSSLPMWVSIVWYGPQQPVLTPGWYEP